VPLPKARLPQDRVGILEDRIAADPRGDTDAWLSLVEEYQQRSNIEEVYKTYERFLKIFPQAVGFSFKQVTMDGLANVI
jgi:cleavage stimulation factor subunit 3